MQACCCSNPKVTWCTYFLLLRWSFWFSNAVKIHCVNVVISHKSDPWLLPRVTNYGNMENWPVCGTQKTFTPLWVMRRSWDYYNYQLQYQRGTREKIYHNYPLLEWWNPQLVRSKTRPSNKLLIIVWGSFLWQCIFNKLYNVVTWPSMLEPLRTEACSISSVTRNVGLNTVIIRGFFLQHGSEANTIPVWCRQRRSFGEISFSLPFQQISHL